MKKKNKSTIRKAVMKEMLDIYYPLEYRQGEKYIDWMGYEIDEDNYPTYHHIEKREELRRHGESIDATLENGAYLGSQSHSALHFIETIDKDLYNSWNQLFLLINKMKCYPTDDVLKIINELQKLSEEAIDNHNSKKLEPTRSVKNGKIKATRIHAALRGYDHKGLQKLRTTTIKAQGIENDIIEFLETLETRKHLLLFFPYEFEFQSKYEFLAGITQIQNALDSDFRHAMQYRIHEVGSDYDTFFAFIYDGKIVFMIEEMAHLSYIDSVDLRQSPVYMRLLNNSW